MTLRATTSPSAEPCADNPTPPPIPTFRALGVLCADTHVQSFLCRRPVQDPHPLFWSPVQTMLKLLQQMQQTLLHLFTMLLTCI